MEDIETLGDVITNYDRIVAGILCMGLNDVVVSASPGGILVSDKEQSSYIKPFVNMLDHQVMFAEESWGKAEMRRAIADGTVMKYLQKVPIHKDDLFFIQAGTVHAIGAGALVAEIQENSNLKKSKQRSAKVQKNI